MKSRIYLGQIIHHRLKPREHRFVYPGYFFAFDLDELENLDRSLWFFGYNRLRLFSLHDKDYLSGGKESIREKLLCYLAEKPYRDSISRIVLLTSARVFNYAFNPASFYYCYDNRDQLLVVLAEVNNTFGERHTYILDQPVREPDCSTQRFHATKVFHVSPFNDVSGTYEFSFSEMSDKLRIGIELMHDKSATLRAGFYGEARSLSQASVLGTMFRYPFSVFLTIPRILWQAAIIYYQKALPVFKKPVPSSPDTLCVTKGSFFAQFARRLVLSRLSLARLGKLELQLPDGLNLSYGEESSTAVPASLQIRRHEFFSSVLRAADVGFGEAYTDGMWESKDRTKLIQFLINNEKFIAAEESPFAFLGRMLNRLIHRSRANTLQGSKNNIANHYDLSNALFEQFLDPTMTYSCAYFADEQDSLEQAQQNKIRKIIEKARVEACDHLLEIGCGWGSFAIETVKQTGCRVTGVTLSKNQLEFALQRVRDAGLEDRISLLLCDYRELQGKFDKIVSIEMLEAVGRENLGTFFRTCDELLKPNGIAVIQSITIIDDRYDSYGKQCDWIQKHIFPGGFLPSHSAVAKVVSAESSFVVDAVESMGWHYALTLREWRKRFEAAREQLLALGFDQRFIRTWNYYFSYCEAGFLSGAINTLQLVLWRPAYKRTILEGPSNAR
jgi:cyclopropane-fatty-acyl-phospholipid synthase